MIDWRKLNGLSDFERAQLGLLEQTMLEVRGIARMIKKRDERRLREQAEALERPIAPPNLAGEDKETLAHVARLSGDTKMYSFDAANKMALTVYTSDEAREELARREEPTT